MLPAIGIPKSLRVTCLAGVVALSACDSTSPKATHPVSINASAAATVLAGPPSGPLEILGLRLSVGQASLGSGEQFGCQDCEDTGSEADAAPTLMAIPIGGGTVVLATERVGPGRYPAVEIELLPPVATAGWATGAAIEVTGTFGGTAFTLPLAIQGTFRAVLPQPVDVPAGLLASPIQVFVSIPVASWFVGNGTVLDPTNPAQRAQIEANARDAFLDPEDASRER